MQKTWFQSLWYWRLAFFECITDALIAGAMVWIAAVANQDWSTMQRTPKEVIIVSVVIAMIKVVKSFLSTTITVLQDNMPLQPGIAEHKETTETVKTVVETPAAPLPQTPPVPPANPPQP